MITTSTTITIARITTTLAVMTITILNPHHKKLEGSK
jgi:hypothetical protein